MYAPLPSEMHVVVRPPNSWVRLGIVPPHTLWTLRRAVYGLRCSPKAWGDERDRKFTALTWQHKGQPYRLIQCINDTQVWRVIAGPTESAESFVGLVVAYVDDLLLLMPDAALRTSFNDALRSLWKLSSEQVLDGSSPFMFLGLEIQRLPNDDILVHQGSFVRQLCSSYGLDSTAKPLSTVSIALPTADDDVAPDPAALKVLQKYAGEFNWLATRTRPDLAYFTSLIASSMKQYGSWTLSLCKKVLRYLVGTVSQGLVMKSLQSSKSVPLAHRFFVPTASAAICLPGKGTQAPTSIPVQDGSGARGAAPVGREAVDQGSFPSQGAGDGRTVAPGAPRSGSSAEEKEEMWDPQQLVVYSDAGFGGVGTRAQTGVLVLWAGSPVLARSSRQPVSALSTCESEVCAAATAWVCAEGLVGLLEEWHLVLNPPILLVDNKSALTLLRLGGSWRTRYFAVRGARIMEELSAGRLQLRYCPTKAMGADGLTKLATGEVMEGLRNIMHGSPFALPTAMAEFLQPTPAAITAEAMLATTSQFGVLSMIEGRRRANALAHDIMESTDQVSDAQLRQVLELWGFAKNSTRRNVAPPGLTHIYSECFGLVYDRTGRWMLSTVASMYPHVACVLNAWFRPRLAQFTHPALTDTVSEWRWTAITVNRGYAAQRHVDMNNYGPSVIRSLADVSDRLVYWPHASRKDMSALPLSSAVQMPISRVDRLYAFDGTAPHETRPYRGVVEDRFSFVFFLNARGWCAPSDTTEQLTKLGFQPSPSEADAQSFALKFEKASSSEGYVWWRLQDT